VTSSPTGSAVLSGVISFPSGTQVSCTYLYATTPAALASFPSTAYSTPVQSVTASGGSDALSPSTVTSLAPATYYYVVQTTTGSGPSLQVLTSSPVTFVISPSAVTSPASSVNPSAGSASLSGSVVAPAGSPVVASFVYASSPSQLSTSPVSSAPQQLTGTGSPQALSPQPV
jgi:hypothetical protein